MTPQHSTSDKPTAGDREVIIAKTERSVRWHPPAGPDSLCVACSCTVDARTAVRVPLTYARDKMERRPCQPQRETIGVTTP